MGHHAVVTVGPHRAHGAELRLLPAEHELHEYERLVGMVEELGQPDRTHRRVARGELAWALLEGVVLDDGVEGQRAAQGRDAFDLVLQRDLGLEQLLAARPVVRALSTFNHVVYYRARARYVNALFRGKSRAAMLGAEWHPPMHGSSSGV